MMRFQCCIVACSLMLVALVADNGWSVESESVEVDPGSEINPAPIPPTAPAVEDVSLGSQPAEPKTIFEIAEEEPWDYSPYRVLIWLVSDDPSITAESMEPKLRTFLDRDFFSLWRFTVADAPAAIRSGARRDIDAMDYELITAADPVLAIKRDHKEAVRIRIAKNVGEFVGKVYGTQPRIDEVRRRAAAAGDPSIDGVSERLQAVDGDEIAVAALWAQDDTEGVLVSRGLAATLTDPEAKLIKPRIANLVGDAAQQYDKIFVVHVRNDVIPHQIEAVELDTLMHHFGPVAKVQAFGRSSLPHAIGRVVTHAFAPIVRIENAGQKNATGLLRARGLIMDEDSPGNIRIDDVLEPMTRKNDRNGKPILIGPVDWSYLLVNEPEISVLQAAPGAGLKVGDRVVSVAGKAAEIPQRIDGAIRKRPTGNKLALEVSRGGKDQKVALDLSKPAPPLQLRYLGFKASQRRDQVIVTGVIPGAPAEGKLQPGDKVLSVNGVAVDGIEALTLSVVALAPKKPADPEQAAEVPTIKLSIQRGEETTLDVELTPTDQSAWKSQVVRTVSMDYYAGRAGGLQGRKNKRTFRTALKVRPFGEATTLRLHLQRYPDFPLIGYELYQKELRSTKMTFIGRTDWNGRLLIERTPDPFRLLYVKNGGAVLARLPLVPGLNPHAVADLSGDDMRLQAEAYIRGVQNSIIDLVAIRKLFEARIMMRLEKGEMEKAETLMEALRNQPSNEQLATDMGKKQTMFIKALGTRNANQRRKVDEMFTTTRELLAAQINPRLVRELEDAVIEASKNGGRLPKKADEDE